MAAPTDNFQGPLKYQTWTLKVPIHCEGCKKKVKKILQKIDGVYMSEIDAQQHKVTVTGNIDAQTLLHKLSKSGKPAELWGGNQSMQLQNLLLEAPSKEKDKTTKAVKGSDEKSSKKNKKEKKEKEATEDGGQKKDNNSAVKNNHSNPAKTLAEGEKAPPLDGDKPSDLKNSEEIPQVDGNKSGVNSDKKKKKKSKGNNGNSGTAGNPMAPTPASAPSPAPTMAPVPAETSAPTPVPTESPASAAAPTPVPTEALEGVSAGSPAETPVSSPAPAPEGVSAGTAAETHAPVPAQAPVERYTGPSMHQDKPVESLNDFGPSNNFGPPPQSYPQGPYHGPKDNFGPVYQHDYMHAHAPAHHPPPQLGVSYSMAQPSTSSSYYVPPYYAYQYPQYPMMNIPPPPPPPNPINEVNDYDNYYNDDSSQCRLM